MKIKNKKLSFILAAIIIILIGTIFVFINKSSKYSGCVEIEKVYYTYNLKNEYSAAMYIVYNVNSCNKSSMFIGASPNLKTGDSTDRSSFYTYDQNKSLIEASGFPTVISYETFYKGSGQSKKFISTFVVDKTYIQDNKKMTLSVPVNEKQGAIPFVTEYEYANVDFKINDIVNFEYKSNEEFIKEFSKDY